MSIKKSHVVLSVAQWKGPAKTPKGAGELEGMDTDKPVSMAYAILRVGW